MRVGGESEQATVCFGARNVPNANHGRTVDVGVRLEKAGVAKVPVAAKGETGG